MAAQPRRPEGSAALARLVFALLICNIGSNNSFIDSFENAAGERPAVDRSHALVRMRAGAGRFATRMISKLLLQRDVAFAARQHSC